MAGKFTCGFRLGHYVHKVIPFAVTEKLLKVTAKPEFDAAFGLPRMGFK
ncbi:MAG: hypothetical protein HGB06_02615 [Chlorobaculum sp.]|nr:hypothetical protein [Chlorobaculum sp.]